MSSQQTLFITEIADPNDNSKLRYVELYSPDSAGQVIADDPYADGVDQLVSPGMAAATHSAVAFYSTSTAQPVPIGRESRPVVPLSCLHPRSLDGASDVPYSMRSITGP